MFPKLKVEFWTDGPILVIPETQWALAPWLKANAKPATETAWLRPVKIALSSSAMLISGWKAQVVSFFLETESVFVDYSIFPVLKQKAFTLNRNKTPFHHKKRLFINIGSWPKIFFDIGPQWNYHPE